MPSRHDRRSRNRQQFRLSTLLLVTSVSGMLVGLGAAEARRAANCSRCITEIREQGGEVYSDFEMRYGFQPPKCKGARQILFECILARPYEVTAPRGDPRRVMASVTRLRTIARLNLTGLKVTDERIAELHQLPMLEELHLDSFDVTDAGLPALAQMRRLRRLVLFNAAITDGGIAHLCQMTHLEELQIEKTRLSRAGVTLLRQSLPSTSLYGLAVIQRVERNPSALFAVSPPLKD